MIRYVRPLGCAIGLALAVAVRADEGMWLPNKPPVKQLKERYGFEPTAAWLEHVQKSCVRFSSGGSGSIVSGDGLVMTNHHVGSDNLERFSTSEKNLLMTGFFARTRDEELKCEDLELNALWSIDDVTERINAAVTPSMSAADANAARRKAIATVESECEDKTKLDCQVVTLYHGGRYHLYRYQRYTDIRLVMAPESQIAFFGGDPDNFEYPRFDLDMCFFRIYEDGKPLKPEHYLKWSANGAADRELTFVAGHPGRTQRLFTVDHLKFLRDVEYPAWLERLWRREVQLTVFSGRSDENARIATGDSSSVQNSRKAITGVFAGLQDPEVFKQKSAAEKKLRDAAEATPEYKQKWGDAWDQIALAERTYRTFFTRYQLLEARPLARSELFSIARHLVRLAEEKPKPSGERLREYRDSELDSQYLQLYSPAPIYDDLEVERLTSGLSNLAEKIGGDDPTVVAALAGRSPHERAEWLVRGFSRALPELLNAASGVEVTQAQMSGEGTKLKDVATRKRIAETGTEAIASSKDPLIRQAVALDAEARALRKRFEDEVESVEREAYAKIAAAVFALNGEDMYPDATFTLRLAFGPVKGYREGGRDVAPFSTLAGLYQRSQERHGAPPFDLPQRWIERKDKLKLDTPFNFVNTADIIGGNSGSPVINKAGEVVGLIFDGNLQGLILDIEYTEEQARAVAVDSRAIIEALRKVYDAGTLADEITRAAAGSKKAD